MLSFLKTKNIKVKILSLFSLNYSANILQLFAKVDCNRADPGFFLGGGALVSCSTNTNKPHSFFCAEYQLY